MKFFPALGLVSVRAQAMQAASELVDSGMMTVMLAADHRIKYACALARSYCKDREGIEDPVCCIASHLYTSCKVVAGHTKVNLAIKTKFQ